jgi:plastocyanin
VNFPVQTVLRDSVVPGLLSLVSASLPAAAQCAITGTVALQQDRDAPVMIKRYDIVAKGGAVAPNPAVAVVYLEGKFPAPRKQPVAQLIQKDYRFVPALLPVQTGTKIEFPNHDDVYHNVFSYSKPKRFDLGRYRPEERPIPSQVFDKPGLVRLYCEIHEHMRGLILVLDTPHFVVTDHHGRFKLTDLPEGTYTLKAWHDSKKTLSRQVVLKRGPTQTVSFP